MADDDKYLTRKELANQLGLSSRSLKTKCKEAGIDLPKSKLVRPSKVKEIKDKLK